MKLLVVDPGMAKAAAAIYLPERRGSRDLNDPQGFLGAIRCLVDTRFCRTSADDSETTRLGVLSGWLMGIIRDLQSDGSAVYVVIEKPRRYGSYQRNRGKRRTKGEPTAEAEGKLRMALGALFGTANALGCMVRMVPASAKKKRARTDELELVMKAAGVEPMRPWNEDVRAAVWIGWQEVSAIDDPDLRRKAGAR